MTTTLDDAAYRAAEQLLPHNRAKLVRGDKVRPFWIDGGARFWYRADTAAGRRFVLVDVRTGGKRPAFDHDRLAKALEAASGHEVSGLALPFAMIDFSDEAVEFYAFDAFWRCSLRTYAVQAAAGSPPGNPLEETSPDGLWSVFKDGPNLGLRTLADGSTRALTIDGEADREYAVSPDHFQYDHLLKLIGLPHAPIAAAWSPDSTRVLTHRSDHTGIGRAHQVEVWPAGGGRPQLHTQRLAHPGDERTPLAELAVIDVRSGQVVRAQADPEPMTVVSPVARRWAWWAEDGSAVYYLSQPRDLRTLSLKRMDPATGEVTTVLSETGDTRVEPTQYPLGQMANVRVLSGGAEVLWYSQRDGWGHLYLYDVRSGRLRVQVTSGAWAVQEILHVDEAGRTVYFTASGLIGEDPYRRSVCRASLDGGSFARITGDALHHVVAVAPDGRSFVDTASTTDTPPLTTVRDWDGRVLAQLERADITALMATGWSAPERFRAKAADGLTDVYGVLYRPHDFDPAKTYPIIDTIYPGPHMNRVAPTFDPGVFGYEAEALAALGFVVIGLEGRGTPGRDKAFHDHSYLNYKSAGALDDHVAAIRDLARSRPWMDLNRIGVTGVSGGGYASVRALLDHSGFYSVAVARSGNHDNPTYLQGWSETYDGPVGDVDYVASSNAAAAHRLRGKLFLIHGGMDNSVLPEQTLRLVDRLVAADKDFDMLIVPGAEHMYFSFEHYVFRKIFDYFVRHLHGAEPPAGYRFAPSVLDAEAIAELFG